MIEALAYLAWLVAVAAAWDFGVFQISATGWAEVGVQVGGYAVSIAPIVVFAPGILASLAMPRVQALTGGALVAAAIVYAGAAEHLGSSGLIETVVKYVATGVGEELAFRGFLWDRMRTAGLSGPLLVAANTGAFVAWHLVSVAAGQNQLSDLLGVAVFGVVFAVARLWSKNTGLPALLHIAADIAGL